MSLLDFNLHPHVKETWKRSLLLWIVVGSGLIGCNPDASRGTTTPATAPTADPTPTETESIIEPFPITKIHISGDQKNDEIIVTGLIDNDTSESWGNIQVEVILYNSFNSAVAEQMTQPTLSILAPGEASPFIVRFSNSIQADHAQAAVTHTEPATDERIDISVTELETRVRGDGMIEVMGEIKNMSYGHAAIENAGVVLFDDDNPIIEYVPITLRKTYVDLRGSTPFIVPIAPQNDGLSRAYFVNMVEIDEPDAAPISIPGEPLVRFTAQRTPYLVETLRNSSSRAQWASAMAIVEHNGSFVYMFNIHSPIPLAPDEDRPFYVDLSEIAPLMDERSQDDDIVMRWYVDPVESREAQNRPAALDLNIDQIETIGSTVYYRGNISNPYDVEIENPSVLGALRTVRGGLVSAGWAHPAGKLLPGETSTFTLALDLPEGLNSWDLEIDLRALGVVP